MEISIRPYQKNDTQAIVEILNDAILNSTALYDYHPRTVAQQEAIFEDKLQKNYPIIVATDGDKVVGFGYYSEFRFREAYQFTVEHSVYVSNAFQGKGVGSRIMSHLIDLAKKQKRHTMIAVIDSENQSSVLFHEQFGFKTVAVLRETGFKFDRWLHSQIMQLMLE